MADVLAPLAGKILAVLVKPGSKVEEDDELVVIEALKMENTGTHPAAAR
jgi:biotin carboxyl carrier protein